jgi:hypothetical protein
MNPIRSSPASSNRHQQLLLLEELRRLDQHIRHPLAPDSSRRDPYMDLRQLLRTDQTKASTLLGAAGDSRDHSGGNGALANSHLDTLRKIGVTSRLHRPVFGGGLSGAVAPSSPSHSHHHGRVAEQGMGVSKLASTSSSFPSVQGPEGSSRLMAWDTSLEGFGKQTGGIAPSGKRSLIQDEINLFKLYQHRNKRAKNGLSGHVGSPSTTIDRVSCSRVVLPSLTSQRSTAAPMTSFQRLWESQAMASYTNEIRKEVFVRRVAHGRVPIMDNSERLPRGRNVLLEEFIRRQAALSNQRTEIEKYIGRLA